LMAVAGLALTLALRVPSSVSSLPAPGPSVAYSSPGALTAEVKPPADTSSVALVPEGRTAWRSPAARGTLLRPRGGESRPPSPDILVALPPSSTETATPTPVASESPTPVEPAVAYVPPVLAPAPTPTPAAPSPLPPAAPAPPAIAAVPPAALPTSRLPEAPSPQPPLVSGARPVVTHTPPEAMRQLRWTPAQQSSVVVFQRRPSDRDTALAAASEALGDYERRLQRSETKGIVVTY